MENLVPRDYREWKDCIVRKCGIELTPQFITKRINSLVDTKDSNTALFTSIYGENHRQMVLAWFEQALEEAGKN